MDNRLLSILCVSTLLCVTASGFKTVPYSRTARSDSDVAFKSFVFGVNDIETKLGQSLHSKQEDSVVCIPSVQILLGLLYAGAGGNTASELESLFGANDKKQTTLENFKKFSSDLQVPEVKIANTMYVANNVVLKKEFLEIGEKYFNVTVNKADFTAPGKCADTINNWVAQKTENLIKQLVTPDGIDPDTKLMLVNAIFFKGKWEYKFDAEKTRDGKFRVSTKEEITVKHMVVTNDFDYAEDEDYTYVNMPYTQKKLSMVVILPKNHEVFERKNISKPDMKALKFKTQKVHVLLPKFKVESTVRWGDILKSKIPSAFGPGANFSGVTNGPIYVSKVVQKAFIQVDEEGTKASAATAVSVLDRAEREDSSEVKEFYVDRPFYYAIVAKVGNTNTFLFQGAVKRPNL